LLICKIYAIIICDALNKLFGGASALVTLHEHLQVLKIQERSRIHGLPSVKKVW